MCGIAGIIGPKANRNLISTMLETQKHRGPDYTGYWIDSSKVALGHNRLSIIDLSEGANQPFWSECGNWVLIFNGEIYNYLELKKELQSKFTFKTQSDTEVLLFAYLAWGEECLDKCNGMFSFAIWNKKEQILFAARDRFGVKPFHYYWNGIDFIFASEINPIFSVGIQKIPNDKVWLNYFTEGSYGNPYETFWNTIHQLPGGHYLTLKDNVLHLKKWYHFEERIAYLQNKFHEN